MRQVQSSMTLKNLANGKPLASSKSIPCRPVKLYLFDVQAHYQHEENTEVLNGNMLKAVNCSWLRQQASKSLALKQKMSCLRTKDILFGGDGSDILGTLTDKGQNRLYGGEDKISILASTTGYLGKRATISCSLAMAAVP